MAESTGDLKNDPRWVKKFEAYFDSLDYNKNGILTIDEALRGPYNMQKLSHTTPHEIAKLDAAYRAMWGAIGLTSDKDLTKREFVEGSSRIGKAEREKKIRGEPTLLGDVWNAYFDILDINKDGTVSLEELQTCMDASTLDSKGAESWFNKADVNQDGKVDREELINSVFSFWLRPEDESTRGLFGGAYE